MRLEFRLKPKQRQFVESNVAWTAFIGGVGSGKTHSGAIKSIMAATGEPGSLGLIAAPTYTMLRDTTQRKFLELLPPDLIGSFNKNEQHLYLKNGSEILFRSMSEPDRSRGINLAWFWLDEGPFAGYYAWQLLKQRAGRQDPHRYRKRGWVTGTPKGRDGFYQEFEVKHDREHLLINSSTMENLSNLPADYVEGMNFTGAFYAQEVLGQFTAFDGLVYRVDTNPESAGTHVQAAPTSKRFTTVIGGVDWGYTNPTVALVAGIDGDGVVWVLREFYQRKVPVEAFVAEVVAFTAEYGVEAWYCDPAEPEHIAQLRAALDDHSVGAEAAPADNSIIAGIQSVTAWLAERSDGRPGLRIDPSCVNLLAEFQSYQYASRPEMQGNELINERPIKQNDHAVDALRYLVHTHLGAHRPTTTLMTAHTPGSQPTVAAEAELASHTPGLSAATLYRTTTAARFLRRLEQLGS